MEIKAQLQYPYSEDERVNFIIEQNHNNGYEIREYATEFSVPDLQAWGYTCEELTEQRKQNFEAQFLQTSLGNYRLQPKGYANAQQSIDTINNMVNAMDGLTEQIASMVFFYQTPDFSNPEECTEEWLVAHQYNPQPMTKIEWTKFYIEFTTLYAQKQYRM